MVDYWIWVGDPDCDFEDLLNTCNQCEPVMGCLDPCDPLDCELCFGEEELPPGCNAPECPGLDPMDPGDDQIPCEIDADCPQDFYCQTGCCEPIPV